MTIIIKAHLLKKKDVEYMFIAVIVLKAIWLILF